MLQLRKAHERGNGSFDWLESYHTFSFANYYDPKHIHFSHLRVINEDFIAPNYGFGKHPHDNMEILTYVLSGRVAHEDSMGNKTEVKAGEFQIMSAGTGIFHSEVNPSSEETLHLYQIWIIPNQKDVTPRYSQDKFAPKEGATLILSPNAEEGSFKIYQDMKLWRYQYPTEKSEQIALNPNRSYWLQVVKGNLSVNGVELSTSDALGIRQETALEIAAQDDVEFLLFDLV
ncbi:quercetin 2,3-dioxygenase yhhW [Mannheimia varigena USDA-ARS-USMARC-1296]|uniref:Quercetin 2,3-dioxygenase yhhW n=1 Tax=Mannheimia varigena USDA-ARS-USMARC-1296 TaxID=1433287 RepID=W0Q935_9PAST|nr:pirin family protein [Mannheimia varigena]AHG74802.1 quercetin 2,3-dioxygenase yhhW [Mannheimia varigena USDA-ARS-USMARC-1296]